MKRHPFDLTSFIFGAVFGGAAAAYLLADQLAWDVDGRWVLPVALIVLGVAGIAGAVGGLRSRSTGGRSSPRPLIDADELVAGPGQLSEPEAPRRTADHVTRSASVAATAPRRAGTTSGESELPSASITVSGPSLSTVTR